MKSYKQKTRSLELALGSIRYAIRSVDPARLVRSSVKLRDGRLLLNDIRQRQIIIDLKLFESVYLIGAGKGTAKMASAVSKILADQISGGAITIP